MVKGTYLLCRIGLLAALAAVLAAATWQQSAQAQSTTKNVHQLKSRVFHFPIRIDPDMQSRIKEVSLFMREGNGRSPWVRVDTVLPSARKILCQVPHDGEFMFQVVTKDLQNRYSISDLNSVAPVMVVSVNTAGQTRSDPPITIIQSKPLPQPEPQTVVVTPVNSEQPSIPVIQNPTEVELPIKEPMDVPSANPPAPSRIVPTPSQAVVNPTATLPSRLINSQRVAIEYNARAGASGVAKIDVWMTPDNGRNWQKIGEDTSHRSPIQVELPGEGVFGVRLVATNGNGFSGKAPVSGELPTSTFEVDMTGPVIQSLEPESVARNGVLDIHWKVTDKNLGNETVNLYYSSQRNGPWTSIAFKVKCDETYHWTLPRDVSAQLYFRLEASDMVGNVSRFDTKTPLMLDMTVPEIDVTGIQPQPVQSK